jgi:DNA-binding HxlR family transcriptional regulator
LIGHSRRDQYKDADKATALPRKGGVILRTVYPEVPPHVEYQITDFVKTLIPILEALCDWRADYLGIDEYSVEACSLREAKG